MNRLVDNKSRSFQIVHSFEGLINGRDIVEVMAWGRTHPPYLNNFAERVRID